MNNGRPTIIRFHPLLSPCDVPQKNEKKLTSSLILAVFIGLSHVMWPHMVYLTVFNDRSHQPAGSQNQV